MKTRTFVLLIALLFVSALSVVGQGVIVPGPCERCPEQPRPGALPRSLPVKSIKIDTKITSQVATTHLEQIFLETIPTPRWKEPTSFPFPNKRR